MMLVPLNCFPFIIIPTVAGRRACMFARAADERIKRKKSLVNNQQNVAKEWASSGVARPSTLGRGIM